MDTSPSLTVEREISLGHRLPSYAGVCSSPHGHNVRVQVQVFTNSVFIDFKYVSEMLWLVLEPLDHAMVLHVEDPLLPLLRDMNFRTVALNVEPTTEALAQLVFNELRRGFDLARVTVHETSRYSATAVSPSAVRRVDGGVAAGRVTEGSAHEVSGG